MKTLKKVGVTLLVALLSIIIIGNGPASVAFASEVSTQLQVAELAATSQTLTVSATAVAAPVSSRGEYSITEYSVVQWPVPSTSGRSKGFGAGAGLCAICSHFHAGQDLLPGYNYPVKPIAEGTVIYAGDDGSLGQVVRISHVIDGVAVTSVYAHLRYNSITVNMGDVVDLNTVIGNVGATGAATGPHLHLEIHVNSVPTSPIPWLNAHANADLWAGLITA